MIYLLYVRRWHRRKKRLIWELFGEFPSPDEAKSCYRAARKEKRYKGYYIKRVNAYAYVS